MGIKFRIGAHTRLFPILGSILFLFNYSILKAQDQSFVLAPLVLNKNIPEKVMQSSFQVLNHPDLVDSIKLNDYEDKLIILGFWATWCSSCIENFSNLQKIQDENKHQVQILLINSKSTRDSPEKVKGFFIKKEEYRLPSIVMDTTFKQLFPHGLIPHYVWIKDGKFFAITNGKDITKENIFNALNGTKITNTYFAERPYNLRQPLFENGNGGEAPEYIYKTILTRYVPGLRSSMSRNRNRDGMLTKITFTNRPILSLYSYSYPEFQNLPVHRMKIEIDHLQEDDQLDNSSLDWMKANLFNYEIQFPPASEAQAKQMVRDDLIRYFGYVVKVEDREIKCWVLKNTEKKELDQDTQLNPVNISDMLLELEKLFKMPFINESGFKDSSFWLNVPDDLSNLDLLQRILESQGLRLVKEKRMISMVILTSKEQ